MNKDVFDKIQDLVINAGIPEIALYLFMNEIPAVTITFSNAAVIEMKTGIRNGKPSFSLEMYKKSEADHA